MPWFMKYKRSSFSILFFLCFSDPNSESTKHFPVQKTTGSAFGSSEARCVCLVCANQFAKRDLQLVQNQRLERAKELAKKAGICREISTDFMALWCGEHSEPPDLTDDGDLWCGSTDDLMIVGISWNIIMAEDRWRYLMQDLAVCGTEDDHFEVWSRAWHHQPFTIHLSSISSVSWPIDPSISIISIALWSIDPPSMRSGSRCALDSFDSEFPRQEAAAESLVDCTEAITREYELIYTAPWWRSMGGHQGLGLMSLFGDLFHITFPYLLEIISPIFGWCETLGHLPTPGHWTFWVGCCGKKHGENSVGDWGPLSVFRTDTPIHRLPSAHRYTDTQIAVYSGFGFGLGFV